MSKKRKLFTLSATTVVASAAFAGAVYADNSFIDVTAKNSHYEGIQALAAAEVINGYSDGTFRPSNKVTRGQVAKMIVKAYKIDTSNIVDPGFKDVPSTNELYPYIATLKALNIVGGYSDDTFRPNEPVNRAQIAKMIALTLNLSTEGDNPFTDNPSNKEATSFITALYNSGIANGTTATTFSPGNHVTRGQVASFIYRGLDVLPFELSILHTNDVHSRVEAYPKLASAVKEQRAAKENSLLLDAGDFTTGTLYYNEFKGEAEAKFMNLLGYDAGTFGNHEFDDGSSATGHSSLKNAVTSASFPFLSANVNFDLDPLFKDIFHDGITDSPKNGEIYGGIIKEIDGEKVGIFALTTAETVDISSPGSITFDNYIEAAKKAVAAFEVEGVNKIIALTHIGYDDAPAIDNDQILAKSVEGIDIIVGGHSHTQLNAPVEIATTATGEAKDPTIIVQAYQYGDFLGTLDVSFDKDGIVTAFDGKLLKVADYAADEAATALLAPYKARVDAVSNTETGVVLKTALTNPRSSADNPASVRANETVLGNLITDAMYNKAQGYSTEPVIFAFQNGGGIRAAINEGPVTVGEVITVLPFGNTLATVKLTGAELKATLEQSVKSSPGESGGFLHLSGGKFEYDSSKPAGERVVSIKYKDKAGNLVDVVDTANYVIATNAFTAKGGDGFTVLQKAYEEGRVTDLGLSDWENFRDHLLSLPSIPTEIEGRIVDLAKK